MTDDSQREDLNTETDEAADGSPFSNSPEPSLSYDELVNRAVENLVRVTEDTPAETEPHPHEGETTLPDPSDDAFANGADVADNTGDADAAPLAYDMDEQALNESQGSYEKDVDDDSLESFGMSDDDDLYDGFTSADDDDPFEDDEEPYESDEDGGSPLARAESAARIAQQSIKDSIEAFKSVREASQLHSDAREELRFMQETLDEHTAELEHRIDIEKRYPKIVSEQTAEMNEATALAQQAQQRIVELEADRADLEDQLALMKNRHDDQLRPYLSMAETAKGRADDAARALADRRRAVKNAETKLADASKQRDQHIAAVNRARDTAQDRLLRLDAEINDAQSSEEIDTATLSNLLDDRAAVQANLESVIQDIPRVSEKENQAVTVAQDHLFEQRQVLSQYERNAEIAKKEATKRRADYDQRLKKAQDEERVLSEQIKACASAAEQARQEAADAQQRADLAAETLQEAEAIHATPHQTIALRDTVAREQTDIHMQQDAVDELAANERELRKGTFKQRLLLILGAVGALVLVIAIVVAIILGRNSAKSTPETAPQPTQIETPADASKDANDGKQTTSSTTTDDEDFDDEDVEDESDKTTGSATSTTETEEDADDVE